MSVIVSHEDVEIRLESRDHEGDIIEFNWLELRVCHSTIINLLKALDIKGLNSESYSVNVSELINALTKWDGERLNTEGLQYKPTEYINRMILKLGMMAMGCKMNGIEEISWG